MYRDNIAPDPGSFPRGYGGGSAGTGVFYVSGRPRKACRPGKGGNPREMSFSIRYMSRWAGYLHVNSSLTEESVMGNIAWLVPGPASAATTPLSHGEPVLPWSASGWPAAAPWPSRSRRACRDRRVQLWHGRFGSPPSTSITAGYGRGASPLAPSAVSRGVVRPGPAASARPIEAVTPGVRAAGKRAQGVAASRCPPMRVPGRHCRSPRGRRSRRPRESRFRPAHRERPDPLSAAAGPLAATRRRQRSAAARSSPGRGGLRSRRPGREPGAAA